jgi:hypothetical protein
LPIFQQGREKIQINKIKDLREDITTNTNEIQKNIGNNVQIKMFSNKLENLEEMEKFLDTFD